MKRTINCFTYNEDIYTEEYPTQSGANKFTAYNDGDRIVIDLDSDSEFEYGLTDSDDDDQSMIRILNDNDSIPDTASLNSFNGCDLNRVRTTDTSINDDSFIADKKDEIQGCSDNRLTRPVDASLEFQEKAKYGSLNPYINNEKDEPGYVVLRKYNLTSYEEIERYFQEKTWRNPLSRKLKDNNNTLFELPMKKRRTSVSQVTSRYDNTTQNSFEKNEFAVSSYVKSAQFNVEDVNNYLKMDFPHVNKNHLN